MITILISFITLIFGELVPKRIALQKAESYSMFCAKPILVISKIASPFIKILSWSTKFILRIFGMADENVEAVSYTHLYLLYKKVAMSISLQHKQHMNNDSSSLSNDNDSLIDILYKTRV